MPIAIAHFSWRIGMASSPRGRTILLLQQVGEQEKPADGH
jgi:hypothetical protein